jgi:septal ring factor EnvC (AmiA/AmiB activator)
MKQSVAPTVQTRSDFEEVKTVSDMVWETFDGLFKTLHRQGRRVEELERRVVELERRLQERAAQVQHAEAVERVTQMPAEKAA